MTQDRRNRLMNQDAQIMLAQMRGGMSAVDAAAELYVRAMPHKEAALAAQMAQRVEQAVRRFEAMEASAMEAPDAFAKKQLDVLCEGKSEEERKNVMQFALAALVGTDNAQGGDAKEISLEEAVLDALEGESLSAEYVQALADAEPAAQAEGYAELNAHDRRVALSMLAMVHGQQVEPEMAAAAVCYADAAQAVMMKYGKEEAPVWLHVVAQVAVIVVLMGLYILAESVLIPAVIATGGLALAAEQSIMAVLRFGMILSYANWGSRAVKEWVDDIWDACRRRKHKVESAQNALAAVIAQNQTVQTQQEMAFEG